MKFNFYTIIFSIVLFIFTFVVGIIIHSLVTAILLFLLFFYIIKLNLIGSILFSLLLAGIFNFIINFRVFIESIIVELGDKEGLVRYWSSIFNSKKEDEKVRVSVRIRIEGKYYRVVEFAKYFFDPRAKDKNDLKGFLIFLEEDERKKVDEEIKKKVLGVYLFWRYIYFENVLGDIKLKPNSKNIFRYQLRFQEDFKKKIDLRIKNDYGLTSNLKDKNFISILKLLDAEVLEQYPFVKKKIEIQISIFDSLYTLFTSPSDECYYQLISKIEEISHCSEKENKTWSKRLTTWKKLVDYYDIKIEEMPNPDFKKVGMSVLIDLIKYTFSKKAPLISEDTLKDIFVEGIKIPRKDVLRFLNNYFILHKTGIDAIRLNIKINKKFADLADYYKIILGNPPMEKVRN